MDFHKDMKGVTAEQLKMAHEADVSVQEKYGVKYHHFWSNEKAGNVFCLMEGPDLESCSKVHHEAHPDYMACAIIEIDKAFVDLAMGNILKSEDGLVREADGSVDLGYRSILMVDVNARKSGVDSKKGLEIPRVPKSAIRELIGKQGGRLLEVAPDDVITSIFNAAADAVQCSWEVQRLVRKKVEAKTSDWNIQCKIGLAAGQPVTENNDFFEETLRLSRVLVTVSENDRINISSLVGELCDVEGLLKGNKDSYKTFRQSDESFLLKLHIEIRENLNREDFNVERLCEDLGISRPQLYRKVTALTGKSPNELIRDVRMRQALYLLNKQDSNVAEIALQVGISNPSYFAKCFQDKYGIPPSKL